MQGESKTTQRSRNEGRQTVRLNQVSYLMVNKIQHLIFERDNVKIPYTTIIKLALEDYENKVLGKGNGFI